VAEKSVTEWLDELRRKAHTNCRRHPLQAAVLAAFLGRWLIFRPGPGYGLDYFDGSDWVIPVAMVWGVCWLCIASEVLFRTRRACQVYITDMLVESGLLYLVMEHDLPERSESSGVRARLLRLIVDPAHPQSLRMRLTRLIRRYPACARRLRVHPYPRAMRLTVRVLAPVTILGGVAYCVLMFAYAALTGPTTLLSIVVWWMRSGGWCGLVGFLTLAALNLAGRTGLVLALVDVLRGEQPPREVKLYWE